MLPDTALAEDHFFFRPPGADQALYARFYGPATPADLGVVIVPPIGRERVRVATEMAFLGRDLASAGFAVLRFDYRGEGESEGDFQASTITSRVADVVAAAEELRRRSALRRVALVGFHLGSAIAGLSGAAAGADRLVLCDPLWDFRAYVRNLLRANVLQQSQYFGRATALETDLRATWSAGHPVTIYGFPMAAPLVDELDRLELAPALRSFRGKSAILHFAPRAAPVPRALHEWGGMLGAPAQCCVSSVVTNFSWTTGKRFAPRMNSVNEAIIEWLRNNNAN